MKLRNIAFLSLFILLVITGVPIAGKDVSEIVAIVLNMPDGTQLKLPVCLNKKSRFGDQTLQGAREFPTLAKTGLHSDVELMFTKTITGKGITRITEDSQPGMYSASGFLNVGEDIISVISADNLLVYEMNLKHTDLSTPLFYILEIIEHLEQKGLYEPGRWTGEASFTYNSSLVSISISGPGKGCQESIFNDEIEGCKSITIKRNLNAEEREYLKKRYEFLSADEKKLLERKLCVITTSEMEPYYISRYGFYEGHVDYRTDPVSLAFIFGLKSIEELEHIFPGMLYDILTSDFTRAYISHGGV
ncbi:MAG: hypothetical protein JW737_06765 [Acidobacteria bacterium]|nr:hypothetical protein [Acidobacteriota bacterium]